MSVVGFWAQAPVSLAEQSVAVRSGLTDTRSADRSAEFARLCSEQEVVYPLPGHTASDQRQGRTVQPAPC